MAHSNKYAEYKTAFIVPRLVICCYRKKINERPVKTQKHEYQNQSSQ